MVSESTYAMAVVARTAKKANKKNSFMAKRYFASRRNTVVSKPAVFNSPTASGINSLTTRDLLIRSIHGPNPRRSAANSVISSSSTLQVEPTSQTSRIFNHSTAETLTSRTPTPPF